jgi:hypothetical protein
MNDQDPTNFWDVAALFLGFAYHLTLIGGTVYIIHYWNWDPWWMLVPLLTSVSVKTGRAAWKKDKEKKDESVCGHRS